MQFLLNTTGLDDFFQKLREIGFFHKNTRHLHEYEVLKKYGHGYIKRYSYAPGLHISLTDMTLHEDFNYRFEIQHKFLEICYVKSGYIDIFDHFSNCGCRVHSGESMIFAAEHMKGWGRHPANKRLQAVTGNIDEGYIKTRFAHSSDVLDKIKRLRKSLTALEPWKANPEIKELLDKMFSCSYDDNTLKEIFFNGLVLELLSACMFHSLLRHNAQQSSIPLTNSDIERLYLAKQVLAEKMADPPSIKQLSKIVYLNTYKLKTGFKSLFTTTIYGYLRDIRMEKAKILLQSTDLSIRDISLQIGYCSSSSFSAIFKTKYGFTPKKYRTERLASHLGVHE